MATKTFRLETPEYLFNKMNGLQGSDKISGDPYGIRTRVAAVKGQCPRPLDEGVAMTVVLQEARKESKRDNVR